MSLFPTDAEITTSLEEEVDRLSYALAASRKREAAMREGMRLIRESALDRLRMDDEIVSLVDYYTGAALDAAKDGI